MLKKAWGATRDFFKKTDPSFIAKLDYPFPEKCDKHQIRNHLVVVDRFDGSFDLKNVKVIMHIGFTYPRTPVQEISHFITLMEAASKEDITSYLDEAFSNPRVSEPQKQAYESWKNGTGKVAAEPRSFDPK